MSKSADQWCSGHAKAIAISDSRYFPQLEEYDGDGKDIIGLCTVNDIPLREILPIASFENNQTLVQGILRQRKRKQYGASLKKSL